MDIEEIWSDHKPFILMVAIGLISLLVFQGLKTAIYTEDTNRSVTTARSTTRSLRTEIQVIPASIHEQQDVQDRLEARLQNLMKEVEHKVPDTYLLPESNIKSTYSRVLQNTRDRVVDVASQKNIRVPYELGVPSLTPNTREEMAQYLLGLSVVERVVSDAIDLGVRRIETIEVKPGQGSGFLRETRVIFRISTDGVVLSALLDRVLDPGDPLILTQFHVAHPPRGSGIISTLGLSILKVDNEKPIGEEGVG